MKNIFFGRVSGERFGVGLVVDAFPMGGEVVPGRWVPPGGATFIGAVRVPGGVWGLGVMGSGGYKMGNLSRHVYTMTCGRIWRWIVAVSSGSFEVAAVCCWSPFHLCLRAHTS